MGKCPFCQKWCRPYQATLKMLNRKYYLTAAAQNPQSCWWNLMQKYPVSAVLQVWKAKTSPQLQTCLDIFTQRKSPQDVTKKNAGMKMPLVGLQAHYQLEQLTTKTWLTHWKGVNNPTGLVRANAKCDPVLAKIVTNTYAIAQKEELKASPRPQDVYSHHFSCQWLDISSRSLKLTSSNLPPVIAWQPCNHLLHLSGLDINIFLSFQAFN